MAGIDRGLHVEGLGASREHAWAGVPGVMIFTAFGLHLVRSCAIGLCAGRPRVGNCERNMWWIFCLRSSMLQAQLAPVGMSVETLRMFGNGHVRTLGLDASRRASRTGRKVAHGIESWKILRLVILTPVSPEKTQFEQKTVLVGHLELSKKFPK
ncbi:uncharacterized protein BKA78DRAFT_91049 [Phyllosticta capitalensis]|uniref:uncharacterized protein n=1 Tax=Phyllosticta capitalensis TaxID=121624 RepID=UPI003132756B